MSDKVNYLIRRKLKHLSHEDRDMALNYLVLIGLKHYSLLYTNQDVHLPILEYLTGIQ